MDDRDSVNDENIEEKRPKISSGNAKNDSNASLRVKVDREKTCPMLVRMFCREGGFHPVDLFSRKSTLPDDDELIIYTWKDATLKELSNLIKEVHPESRQPEIQFHFRTYHQPQYSSSSSKQTMEDIGIVYNNGKKIKSSGDLYDEEKTLYDKKFIQGDYIDVAIMKHGKFSLPPQSSSSLVEKNMKERPSHVDRYISTTSNANKSRRGHDVPNRNSSSYRSYDDYSSYNREREMDNRKRNEYKEPRNEDYGKGTSTRDERLSNRS